MYTLKFNIILIYGAFMNLFSVIVPCFNEEKYGKSNKLINKHSDKNIYIIKNKWAKIPKLGENNTATKIDELCCSREIFRIN